jgi:L-ascorbate metabolism protein UlaG (beta-lactamase superfamily)
MRVIDRIERDSPEKRDLRLWYLGGNSLVIQSAGARLYVDPFLVPAALHDGVFRRRNDPPVIAAEVGLIDGILITHEHKDHCNTYTLRALLSKNAVPVIAPPASAEIVRSVADSAAIRTILGGDRLELSGFDIMVGNSGDTVAMNPVSYWIRYETMVLYVAGDAMFVPDPPREVGDCLGVAFLAIATNPPGKEFYPSASKWTEMVRQLLPQYAVPVHWDVWADYYFDPSALQQQDCSGRLTIIPVGGHLDLPARDKE